MNTVAALPNPHSLLSACPPLPFGKPNAGTEELRIAVLSDAILNRNGVGTYYKDLVDHLEGRFERVRLLCPSLDGESENGWAMAMPGDATQKLYMPDPLRISRVLSDLEPHVIVSATPGPYGFFGMVKAKRMGRRVCIGHHTDFDALSRLYWTSMFGKAFSFGLNWFNESFFRSGSMVVATSEHMVLGARHAGCRRVHLVGTPIGKAFLDSPAEPLRERFQTVLFAGRLAPEKNLPAILDAAQNLPDVRFVIAGDGPLRSLVEERARQCANIDFRGWTSREQLVTALDECDLFVLPSHVESFGTVALEAMARGRSVLVSPRCGITQWSDVAPALYVMEEEESLSAAIERVAAEPFLERQGKAELARHLAARMNEATLDEWSRILRKLARRVRRQRRWGW